MLGSELIGRAVEVFSELPYCMEVRFCGLLGVITVLLQTCVAGLLR
jgi:hypothetical protein